VRTTRTHPVSCQCDQGDSSCGCAYTPAKALRIYARDDGSIVMRERKLLHPPP
jgi:hypothetical protein